MSVFQYKKIIFIFLGLIFWIIGIIAIVHQFNKHIALINIQIGNRSSWHQSAGSVLLTLQRNNTPYLQTEISPQKAEKLLKNIKIEHHHMGTTLDSRFFSFLLKTGGIGLSVDSLMHDVKGNYIREDSILSALENRTTPLREQIRTMEKSEKLLTLEEQTRLNMAKIRMNNQIAFSVTELMKVNQICVRQLTLLRQAVPALTLRIYFYLVVLSMGIIFGGMLLTIHFLMSPLEELELASRKIIRRDLESAVYHIPYFGNNVYGRIGLAMRKLVTYMSEIDTMKSNILAQVTHDLKSPLGTFQQGLELLEDDSLGALNKKQLEVLNLMKSAQETMKSMITNLLNTAKIEYDNYKVQFTRFDLIQLCRTVMEEFVQYLKNKNLRIIFNKNNRKHLEIIADSRGLVDILRNLIGNAIKFTPEGGKIYISIGMKNYDVFIQIRDTGIGIPPDELDRIFEKLYRGKNSRQVSVKGTGLGLYLVKQIVNRHNGEIFVSSTVGEGTTFDIHLPRFQSYVEETEEGEIN